MEKKPGLFSALRGLSPGKSRPSNRKKKKNDDDVLHVPAYQEPLMGRSSSVGKALEPLMEGPDPEGGKRVRSGLGRWMKRVGSRAGAVKRSSDLRVLLGVMGAPLAPVHVSKAHFLPHLCIKDTSIERSFAQYILQQYIAASGGQKLQNSIRNSYAMGKVTMLATEIETATSITKIRNRDTEFGGFVLWQMNPNMWYVELAVGGSKIRAGCNGKLVWRHTPWIGAHSAKGPPRPLRRALQGLDPRNTAGMFIDARFIGEREIKGEYCFILKLSADPQTLNARSEGLSEIIRHVLFGYFSQKTGLLIHIEDSHLTRIQSNGGDAVYWETTINSFLNDYKSVDGIMIAHSGRSVVSLFRFGETAMSHTSTRLEETWTIDEMAFNIPGLSMDCFIPPADLKSNLLGERDENGHWSKVADFDNSMGI